MITKTLTIEVVMGATDPMGAQDLMDPMGPTGTVGVTMGVTITGVEGVKVVTIMIG